MGDQSIEGGSLISIRSDGDTFYLTAADGYKFDLAGEEEWALCLGLAQIHIDGSAAARLADPRVLEISYHDGNPITRAMIDALAMALEQHDLVVRSIGTLFT